MSARRITVKARRRSLKYVDISPSKRARRKSVNMHIVNIEPLLSEATVNSNEDHCDTESLDEMEDNLYLSENSSEPSTDQYTRRKERSASAWFAIREQMLAVSVESLSLPLSCECCTCGGKANCRCRDCGPHFYYCEECANDTHKSLVFHRVEICKNDVFHPFEFTTQRILRRAEHLLCDTSCVKEVVCIDKMGNQHKVGIELCSCEPEAVTFLRYNLWPATPQSPSLAFDLEFLELLDVLILECCIGVQGFCRSIDTKLGRNVSRKFRELYPVIIDSFEEYRYLRFCQRSLNFVSDDLNTSTVCPACPRENGTVFESFDALFGLCRKKAAGSSVRPPLFGTLYFDDQKTVDDFVLNYDVEPCVSSKGCHQFLAGDALRSQSQYKALDETAIFGRACRHEFPKQFINLKHGERLSYAVYTLQALRQKTTKSHLVLLYDIACALHKHLKARGQTDLLDGMMLATPTFHAYGHSAECQAQYNPRRVSGCGLTDGEVMERLWSYLRRMAKTTKEMRPSHLIDVLTCALLHYGDRSRQKLVTLLPKRMKHAEKVLHKSSDDLKQLLVSSNVSESEVRMWSDNEVSCLSSRDPAISYGQRHKAFQKIINLAHERKYLLMMKSKYADGQAISTRLCKQITSTTSLLRKSINRFNDVSRDPFEGSLYLLPRTLSWEDAVDLDTLRTWEIVSKCPHSFSLPAKTVRQLIDDLNLKTRAIEEIQLLKEEMLSVVDFYSEEHKSLQQHLMGCDNHDGRSRHTQGCIILLKHRLLSCELMLKHAMMHFSSFIAMPETPKFIILCDSSEVRLSQSFDSCSTNTSDDFQQNDSEDNDEEGILTVDDTSDDSEVSEISEDEQETGDSTNLVVTEHDQTLSSTNQELKVKPVPSLSTVSTTSATNGTKLSESTQPSKESSPDQDSDEMDYSEFQKYELYRKDRFLREEFLKTQTDGDADKVIEELLSQDIPFKSTISRTTHGQRSDSAVQTGLGPIPTSVYWRKPHLAQHLVEACGWPKKSTSSRQLVFDHTKMLQAAADPTVSH